MWLHVVQRADRSLTFSYILYVRPSVRCPPFTNCGHLTLFMKTHFPIRCNRNFFYIRLFLEHVSGEPHLQRRTRKWLQELWLPRGSRAFIFIFRIVVDVGDVEEGRVKFQWTCFIVVSMVCSSAAGLSVRPGCFLIIAGFIDYLLNVGFLSGPFSIMIYDSNSDCGNVSTARSQRNISLGWWMCECLCFMTGARYLYKR